MPGMGDSPGTGAPGFGGPPAGPPPACQQLRVLLDEREKNNTAIRALTEKARAQLKPPDPVELCKLFKVYLVTEDNLVKGDRQPDDVRPSSADCPAGP
jgi:hypothetical protein